MKGADRALGGCRSSIDLLQDRSLSNAPSSPLSRPSKSNLEHERTHMRTHRHIHKRNSVPSPQQVHPPLFRPLWQHKARAARRENRIRHQRPNPGWSYQCKTGQRRFRQLWEGEIRRFLHDLGRWGHWLPVPLVSNGTSQITMALL